MVHWEKNVISENWKNIYIYKHDAAIKSGQVHPGKLI